MPNLKQFCEDGVQYINAREQYWETRTKSAAAERASLEQTYQTIRPSRSRSLSATSNTQKRDQSARAASTSAQRRKAIQKERLQNHLRMKRLGLSNKSMGRDTNLFNVRQTAPGTSGRLGLTCSSTAGTSQVSYAQKVEAVDQEKIRLRQRKKIFGLMRTNIQLAIENKQVELADEYATQLQRSL